MRIIAGEWRGRTIAAPRDQRVRPTADRAREAWMSILQHEIPGARVADLFAGSGALGLEALSRGALSCDFVDLSEGALAAIRANIAKLGAAERSRVHRGDALRLVRKAGVGAWDLAFADPPYRLGLGAALADAWLAEPFANVLSVEHEVHDAMPGGTETRAWGSTAVTIYRR
ncbi:MAG: RsmD family RNA methyltransferase [Gemmatimonadaceae bacterium]|nr:RsmD family RNA methyltransferase [Gemmatimonadaceae bacterium]